MMRRIYESERPIGARTSRALTGGSRFPMEWLTREISEFNDEVVAMSANEFDPELSPQQLLDTITKLHELMIGASQGKCEVGPSNEYPARTLGGAGELIELRPYWDETAAMRPPRLLRLYYGEPVIVPHGLLPLHLASKPNGPDTDLEQDAAIAEADTRATDWAHAKFAAAV